MKALRLLLKPSVFSGRFLFVGLWINWLGSGMESERMYFV